MTRGLRRRPPPPPVAPPPEYVYYEATAKTEVVAGTTDRSRELRGIVLLAGDSFSWPVLYGTPVTVGDGELLGPFTEAEWQERKQQRDAEQARQVRERRAAAEAAAKATAREILTKDAPIEDRVARLAEIIFAAEYGGWDEIR